MKFSVCIPTLNRAEYIEECLSSIFAQDYEDIEIIVVDGGSKDDTPTILEAHERAGRLRSYKGAGKGIDGDILAVAEKATGDYIWFLSDDDALAPGAFRYIAGKLEASGWPAGASVNYVAYDKTLCFPVASVPATAGNRRRTDYFYNSARDCFSELALHLGFLSAQVVKRSVWLLAAESEPVSQCMGTCWMIAAMVGAVLRIDPRWLYIHKPLIKNRTQNDSFQARLGVLRRHTITHVAFLRVAEILFGANDPVLRNIRIHLIHDRMSRTIANVKSHGASIGLQADLLKLYVPIYGRFPSFWMRVVPLFFVPSMAFAALRNVYLYFARLRSKMVLTGESARPGSI